MAPAAFRFSVSDHLIIESSESSDLAPMHRCDLFELVGVADQAIPVAEVSVWPSAFCLVYLSRVDNRSGGGSFVFGSSGPTTSIAGNPDRQHEVRTILTYDDDVTVDWIKWPGQDWYVYTWEPESDYMTESVVVGAPVEYCVDVAGQAGPQLSGVHVSIQTRPVGGDWSGGTTSYLTSGNGPIDHEFCQEIF